MARLMGKPYGKPRDTTIRCEHGRRRTDCKACGGSRMCASTGSGGGTARRAVAAACASTGGGGGTARRQGARRRRWRRRRRGRRQRRRRGRRQLRRRQRGRRRRGRRHQHMRRRRRGRDACTGGRRASARSAVAATSASTGGAVHELVAGLVLHAAARRRLDLAVDRPVALRCRRARRLRQHAPRHRGEERQVLGVGCPARGRRHGLSR